MDSSSPADYMEKLLHVHQAEDAFDPSFDDWDPESDGC